MMIVSKLGEGGLFLSDKKQRSQFWDALKHDSKANEKYFLDRFNEKLSTEFWSISAIEWEEFDIHSIEIKDINSLVDNLSLNNESPIVIGSCKLDMTFSSPFCLSADEKSCIHTVKDVPVMLYFSAWDLKEYKQDKDRHLFLQIKVGDTLETNLDIQDVLKLNTGYAEKYLKRMVGREYFEQNKEHFFSRIASKISEIAENRHISDLMGKSLNKKLGDFSLKSLPTKSPYEQKNYSNHCLKHHNFTLPAELYHKLEHPENSDGGALWEKIITSTYYAEKITKEESKLLKVLVDRIIKESKVSKDGNAVYPGGGGSDKLDFMQHGNLIQKIIYLDNSLDFLLKEQGNTGENNGKINVYGDYYDLSALKKLKNITWSFMLGGDFGNLILPPPEDMSEAQANKESYLDMCYRGWKHYLTEANKNKEIGSIDVLGVFTNQSVKEVNKLYGDKVWQDFYLQPILARCSDSVSKKDLLDKMEYEIIYDPDQGPTGRLAQCGYRVKKGRKITFKDGTVKESGEFIMTNPSMRFDFSDESSKYSLKKLIKERGFEIVDREENKENGFSDIAIKKVRELDDKKTENKENTLKPEDSQTKLSKIVNKRKTKIWGTRLAILVLVSFGGHMAIESITKYNLAKRQQFVQKIKNKYPENKQIDTISLDNPVVKNLMKQYGHIESLLYSVKALCDEQGNYDAIDTIIDEFLSEKIRESFTGEIHGLSIFSEDLLEELLDTYKQEFIDLQVLLTPEQYRVKWGKYKKDFAYTQKCYQRGEHITWQEDDNKNKMPIGSIYLLGKGVYDIFIEQDFKGPYKIFIGRGDQPEENLLENTSEVYDYVWGDQ